MNAQQLKNSILQEAIEGRLVPQDPNDEPASVLLERIREEKRRLVKEGKLKKKDLEETPISEDEKPFEIPESWEWVRMQDVIIFVNGRAYKQEELLENGKYKVLRVGNFFTNDSWYYSDMELPNEKYCYKDDLLYAWSASFGPKIWDGEKTIFHYHIWNVKYYKEILYRDYLYYFFLIDKEKIKSSTTGSTMIHVSMENMKPRLIPIPPLAEQKRIVAKIEELLPKVEEYGKAQDALDKLNAELPERLKKSILQEAIEGRLVPQDPNDEPASILLDKIRAEKAKLVKEGKLKKKDLEETPIQEDEIPFDIPDSWEWCRVKTILNVYSARRVHEKDWRASGIPFYRAREIGKLADYGHVDNELFIDRSLYEEFSKSGVPLPGDLMVTAVGTLGKTYIVKDGDLFYYKDGSVLCFNNMFNINAKFLKFYIESPTFVEQYANESQGTTVATLTMVRVNEYIIPLPPLAEQKRIVAKIEQLLGEIDKLK